MRHDVTEGNRNNWPRKLARRHPHLGDALAALEGSMDEANQRFALAEFIDEREAMQRRALDGAVITAEESSEIIGELSAALAVLAGEGLKPCAHGCPGHLGEKASAAVNASLKAWQALQEGNRAAVERIAELDERNARQYQRIAALEAEVSAELQGQVDISENSGRALLAARARIAALEEEIEKYRKACLNYEGIKRSQEARLREQGQRLDRLDALLASERVPLDAPSVARETPLDPQARGGHTYIHNAAGEYLFRLTIHGDESQIDLLIMAYNSGSQAGVAAAWRWLRERLK
jgi:hypothetical protein